MTGHQLKVYNALGLQIEDFVPSADVVGLYSCGPTVYYFPHLGNMRAYVFADTLRRALRWKQIPVRHVVNITDVGHAVADTETGEDKLEVAAARERRSVLDIAAFYTDAFFVDIAALNILPADEYPRASAYVEQMIEFAAKLEKMIDMVADQIPDLPRKVARKQAAAALATMMGTLVLARIAGNGDFSDEILASGREAVLGRVLQAKQAAKKPASKKAAKAGTPARQ